MSQRGTASDRRGRASDWFLRTAVFVVMLALCWGAGTALHRGHGREWPPRTGSGKLRVLTTIFPLYDFARTIGGPDVDVLSLLPPGVDPHEYALSPKDVATVAGADLLVANGAGLDSFLTDALERAELRGRRPVVDCSAGLRLRQSASGAEGASGDPHLWLDPVYAATYARRIGGAMASAEEARGRIEAARAIRARTAAYVGELVDLDRDYRTTLAPYHGRGFVAFHGAFGYLADRYGLRVAAVWEPSPGREPAARDVGRILATARANRVHVLFSEPSFSPRALDMIAADAHIPIYSLDPVETADDFASTHYLAVMRANLATLVKAFERTDDR